MKKTTIFLLLILPVIFASCSVQRHLRKSPEMVLDDYDVWTVSGVAFNNSDFSGLAFAEDSRRMIAAFNSAGLYWLDIPQPGSPLHFEPMEVNGSKFRKEKRDCECVTLNRKTGDIWFGQERSSNSFKGASLYKIKAPRYSREELIFTFDSRTIPSGNSGIEGLTWIGGDEYIVGREGGRGRKPLVIFFSEEKGVIKKMSVAREIKQIAEIVYDDVRDCLWILDGDFDRMLYRCSMSGKVLDRYPIPYIENAEALLLDRKHNCIWIGSDEVPSKLYRIRFSNL